MTFKAGLSLCVALALSAGAVIFLFVNPYLSGDVARDKRVQGVTEQKVKRGAARGRDDELQNRRKQDHTHETVASAMRWPRLECRSPHRVDRLRKI